LANFVGYPINNIKRYETYLKSNNKSYPTCAINLCSKHLCNSLSKLGCVQAKSFILKYPDWLDDKFHSHFIRGYFDGDGSLSFRAKNKEWKWSLVSTKEYCNEIKKIIYKNTGKNINYKCISKTGNNTYEMEASGNEKINKIMDWLYVGSNNNIRLSRKFEKYKNLLEQQSLRTIAGKYYNTSNVSSNDDLYTKIVEVNGNFMTAKFIKQLSVEDRKKYIKPIFDYFRNNGWIYPSISDKKLITSYKKLCEKNIDIESDEIFNNGSLATDICKHYCQSYYKSSGRNKKNMVELWEDDDVLLRLIENRLVINWQSKTNETFNICHRMMIQGMRSMRLVQPITMFKPIVAKYVCEKYSNIGDTVGDYSCGFGGRLLGAMSCGRKYIGTDPLTVPELKKMSDFFKFNDVTLIHSGSEFYCGDENSVDLYWSSPPYYDLEYYSSDSSQAYNNGEHYFYDIYWQKTLENVKYMLKPGKWFGLNVKNDKMLEMAQNVFGKVVEKVKLKTVKSHFSKGNKTKYEYIYMFIND
jgi:hypothetical protein